MPKYAKTKDSSSSVTTSKRVRYVPFARGFKHRDENACLLALGFNKTSSVPREYSCEPFTMSTTSSSSKQSSTEVFFKHIPQPTSTDDWLAQYDEDGQTYRQFLAENPWMAKRKVRNVKQNFFSKGKTLGERYPNGKVCILQLGNFDDECINFSDIIDYTKRFLCLPVEHLPPLDLEVQEGKVVLIEGPVSQGTGVCNTRGKRTQLHSRFNSKTGHIQLRVDSVLSKLRMHIPSQALCLIALTTLDLYGEASDLFVAGMAAGNQRVAVFSLCRYDPTITFSKEHWYDLQTIPKPVSAAEKACLMMHRSCKLVVHEILHLLGVDHCVFFECCMNGSGHLAEDFRQPMHLCPVDLHKLQTLVGFDIKDRYRSLQDFYLKHGLNDEAKWVQRRLDYLSCSFMP